MKPIFRESLRVLYPSAKKNAIEVLTYLFSCDAPRGARVIGINTGINRSKIYNYINSLLDAELIMTETRTIADIEVPEIYDW